MKYEKILLRFLYLITSKKFVAWAVSTWLLYEGVINDNLWKIITLAFIGAEFIQNWIENANETKTKIHNGGGTQ